MDPRWLCGLGFAGLTYSCWLNAHLDANVSYWGLVWLNTTRSLALPFIFVPLTAIGIQNLPQQQKPEASALFNLTRTLAGSLVIAALGAFLKARETFHFERFGESVSRFAQATNLQLQRLIDFFVAHGGAPATAQAQALGVLQLRIARQALIGAFDDCFFVLTIVSAVAIVLTFIARPQPMRAGVAARPAVAVE
jgi:DHA2 family multidrug resistance protein